LYRTWGWSCERDSDGVVPEPIAAAVAAVLLHVLCRRPGRAMWCGAPSRKTPRRRRLPAENSRPHNLPFVFCVGVLQQRLIGMGRVRSCPVWILASSNSVSGAKRANVFYVFQRCTHTNPGLLTCPSWPLLQKTPRMFLAYLLKINKIGLNRSYFR
jgi:hypothetical protein